VAVKAWEALGKTTGRDHTHLALYREDEKIRYRDIQAQPRKIISSPTWSGIESETVSYNAGYTNVHELIPWRTLTGRQQFYQDHEWMLAFGEGFSSYRPPVDLKATGRCTTARQRQPEILLNFITPHQKWGIHSTYTDNLMMLTLSRGGPIIWLSEVDAKKIGVVDNDWVELFNVNGAIAARAVVSQRVNEGMTLMYHAQEKIVNTPGSEITNVRGGIHNSVTRMVLKPTHMIGGYAQLSYGFNYYGTIGTNRDEFVIVRKMKKIDWLDTPVGRARIRVVQCKLKEKTHESPRPDRHGAEPGQVHRLPHLFGHLQERLDQPARRGVRLVQQRRDQARHRLPQGMGEPGQVERRLGPQGRRQHRAAPGRQVAAADEDLRQPQPAGDRRLLRALHLRLRPPAECAGDEGRADRAAAQPDHRPADGQDRLGPELGGDPGRRVQPSAARTPTSTVSRPRRRPWWASSRTPS
jgi:nitrate reductase alpha subunit